jgi:hypothetical protein
MLGGHRVNDLTTDPGWVPALRQLPKSLLLFIKPAVLLRKAADPLIAMRALVLAWAVAYVAIGVVSVWLAGSLRSPGGGLGIGVAVAVLGSVASVAGTIYVERRRRTAFNQPGVPAFPAELVAALYRQSFFLRCAFSSSAAIMGFIGVRLAGVAFPYAIGLVVASIGLALAAPTAANHRRNQDELRDRGSRLNLVELLRKPMARHSTSGPKPGVGRP